MTTKQRLQQKLAIKKTTENQTITNALLDDPDYKVYFVHLNLASQMPDEYIKFAKWLDDQHRDAYDCDTTARMLVNLQLASKTNRLIATGWFLLYHKSVLVSVATLHMGWSLTFLTTMREHRGKGYATKLLTFIRLLYEKYKLPINCPAVNSILPMVARAGFTTADDEINKDGTWDTMPEFVKPHYRKCTASFPRKCLDYGHDYDQFNLFLLQLFPPHPFA
jgi:GNAT superfamily N-acetyltransferase